LAQFPVDLNQEVENRKQNQQVFGQGRGGTPFCACANRPILSLSLIIQLYTVDWGRTNNNRLLKLGWKGLALNVTR
jgi:hypothetical protein